MGSEHIPAPVPLEQWWLSFCDTGRPKGSQFLGVAIVTAPAAIQAVQRAHEIGVNPGGQVQIVGPFPLGSMGPEWCDRLLTRDEAESVPAPAWADPPEYDPDDAAAQRIAEEFADGAAELARIEAEEARGG